MKILVLDIETRPNVVHTWGLFNQNVSLEQLRQPGGVICFAAKWVGHPKVMFYSDYHDGHEAMVRAAWDLMDEADLIVHYNGNNFDMPWLRTEFVQLGLTPPAPHKDVDLCNAVKKTFRFPSNKLAYVTEALGLTGKLSHTGHQMWVDIMEGDEVTARKAWNLMRRYNKQDVVTTEELFTVLRVWLKLPHPALYNAEGEIDTCECGGELQKRGFAYTATRAYQRYVCKVCGRWMQDTRSAFSVQLKDA